MSITLVTDITILEYIFPTYIIVSFNLHGHIRCFYFSCIGIMCGTDSQVENLARKSGVEL